MIPNVWVSKTYLFQPLIIFVFFCHLLVVEAATGKSSQNLCWREGKEKEEGRSEKEENRRGSVW